MPGSDTAYLALHLRPLFIVEVYAFHRKAPSAETTGELWRQEGWTESVLPEEDAQSYKQRERVISERGNSWKKRGRSSGGS